MNSTKAKEQTLTIILAISVLLFGLDHQHILDTPKDLILILASPIQTPFRLTKNFLTELTSTIRSIPHQQRKIKDLERRLSELSIKANKSAELEKEIASIKANTQIVGNQSYTPVTAKVISLTRFAMINKGASDGIKPGQAVIASDSLVGIIKSVLNHRSLVLLLKDPEIDLDVVSLGGTTGRLKFKDNTLTTEEVLQKNTLSIEDPVYTKGSTDIPDGLLIGYISKIQEKPSNVYKEAYIDQAHEITDQSFVIVAKN